MNQENLSLYDRLRTVPKEAQKPFNNGRFSGTDINPMWRIKRMTEVFGPCGIGWYYEVVRRSLEKSSDQTISAFIGINLYIKVDGEWSKPIYGEGGNNFCTTNKYGNITTSDEAYKMALTDALSNATKQLGLGADIWFANDKNHSTKYDAQQENMNAANKAGIPASQPTAPEQPAPAELARQYLRDNAKAFEFYQHKYSHNATPDDFSADELNTIYQQLKNANKL